MVRVEMITPGGKMKGGKKMLWHLDVFVPCLLWVSAFVLDLFSEVYCHSAAAPNDLQRGGVIVASLTETISIYHLTTE
ncbi:hypothetical protein B0H21DRAFT_246970 [Amylocystis lapponica]|nr:hypothetical protein B0H21DRAFT_246970 [Amylocystis lapponica]